MNGDPIERVYRRLGVRRALHLPVAGMFDERGHGLFTCFFLRGLADDGADIQGGLTTASLYACLRLRVAHAAFRSNRDRAYRLKAPSDAVLRFRQAGVCHRNRKQLCERLNWRSVVI